MSTRGFYGFFYKGETKGFYNHSDSYPSGLGADIVGYVRQFNDEQLAGTANRLIAVSEDDKVPAKLAKRYAEFRSAPNVGNRITADGKIDKSLNWYQLLHKLQGELAPYIDGTVDHYVDYSAFLGDSLFCEWAYIFNMDERVLEVHTGYNKGAAAPGRYVDNTVGWEPSYPGHTHEYYGVVLLDTIGFDELRSLSDGQVADLIAHWEKIAYPDEVDA